MRTALILLQLCTLLELFIRVLFSKRSKLVITTWVWASMGLFLVHYCNVNAHVLLPTELLQALVTLKRLLIAVHGLKMPAEMACLAELLEALVTLMCLFFVVHRQDVSF